MNTSTAKEESIMNNFLNEFGEIKRRYKRTYKGFKLVKETIKKYLLKLASIDGIIGNTQIAVKFDCFDIVLTLIDKNDEIDITDKNKDQDGEKNHKRDKHIETRYIRSKKLYGIKLIKLFLTFDADMNDTWPNSKETLFYYLTIMNPLLNYALSSVEMNKEIISRLVADFFMYPNCKLMDDNINNKNVSEFIMEQHLYNLLLRFKLDKMSLPFLKYKAIIYNRIDILNRLMTYNCFDNDIYENKYTLFKAAFECLNKDAFDVLEKHDYYIYYWKGFHDYFLPDYCGSYFLLPESCRQNDYFYNYVKSIMLMESEFVRDHAYYWLKICFKRRFISLCVEGIWYSILKKDISLNIYVHIFVNVRPGYSNIWDIWAILNCFSSMIKMYSENIFAYSYIIEMCFSELIRRHFLKQLPIFNDELNILKNRYLSLALAFTMRRILNLKTITIYENQTAFDFYLQKKLCKNVDVLTKIMQIIKEKSNNYEIPDFISIPIIKRLEMVIKKEILLKKCSAVLNQLFDLPKLVHDKILSYLTKSELKLLCRIKKEKKEPNN